MTGDRRTSSHWGRGRVASSSCALPVGRGVGYDRNDGNGLPGNGQRMTKESQARLVGVAVAGLVLGPALVTAIASPPVLVLQAVTITAIVLALLGVSVAAKGWRRILTTDRLDTAGSGALRRGGGPRGRRGSRARQQHGADRGPVPLDDPAAARRCGRSRALATRGVATVRDRVGRRRRSRWPRAADPDRSDRDQRPSRVSPHAAEGRVVCRRGAVGPFPCRRARARRGPPRPGSPLGCRSRHGGDHPGHRGPVAVARVAGRRRDVRRPRRRPRPAPLPPHSRDCRPRHLRSGRRYDFRDMVVVQAQAQPRAGGSGLGRRQEPASRSPSHCRPGPTARSASMAR